MATDENDSGSPKDKKAPSPPRQVVVTHYGKKKKTQEDIPPEILPTEPTHIVSSPIDVGARDSQPHESVSASVSESIFPKEPPEQPMATPSLSASGFSSETSEKTSHGGSGSFSSPPQEDNDTQPPQSSGGTGRLIFNFLTLVAVAILGFHAYTMHQQVNELEQRTQDDQTSVQALMEQTKKSFTEMDEMRQHDASQLKSIQHFKNELENAQSRLVDLSGNTNWVLAQANYLAFMANERLKTAHDITTALAQLNAADDALKNLGNPALMGVREALAKDIAKLRTFPTINRQALWEELALFSTELNQLHFKQITPTPPSPEAPSAATEETGWRQALRQSWQELKSLIRITRIEENNIPLALSREAQSQILRTLQLLSEQAQWAVLHGDPKIYSHSLQSLQSGIQQYFADDAVRQHLLEEIKQLEQQQVEITIPDISGSLNALSQAMLQMPQKTSASSGQGGKQ